MGKNCAFCGLPNKITKEHIWPKCIIKRMPELTLRYLGSKKKVFGSELLIADVCEDCNNVHLSKLDNYICLLHDSYFHEFIDAKKAFDFKYNYGLLLRALLKITYNSSRTVSPQNNDFKRYSTYILHGGKSPEEIIVKLDIVTPSVHNGEKVYPSSTRCGVVKLPIQHPNFITRMISINSFYFYIIISKNITIETEKKLNEYWNVFNHIPGTIIHPYKDSTIINQFSTEHTYSIHINHLRENGEAYTKHFNRTKR